ncbi:molybdopterin molybdochelatase [Sanguibacter gelidistatuariae]|uniref:Molybdopterin molybdenumtransferase n=2 Tax=Sanguibacter gelidistatuariae TaxID=1814289 RepID=A0A1G6GQF0_9MICO|nr:molybdopterin molybdochelatase [Sanguibacter gelidistatuariae]
MITVEDQLAHVLAGLEPLTTETLPLAAALGRTLAHDVLSTSDIPVFDNSAMDGYAVRHGDVVHASPDHPVTLRVVADLPAGSPEDPPLAPGTAARIMTGAPVPADADAIVPVEHTDADLTHSGSTHPGAANPGTAHVTITTAPRPAAHIRRAGEDLHAGDVVLTAGSVLSSRHLSSAAAAGHPTLPVHRSPRVAVIATGSELVPPGQPLGRGQIPESNSTLLAALVTEAGGTVERAVTVPDDDDALRAELASVVSAGVDLVVLSGGVSVGAYDVTKAVLAPLGTVDFVSVAMQPGKPQAFGHLPGGTPVFGLPGNPVSACVSFEVFVRPALSRLLGRTQLFRRMLTAQVSEGWRTPLGRAQYMPVVLDDGPDGPDGPATRPGQLWVRPATRGGSGSHLVGGLGAAEGFAVVPADVTEVRQGDMIDVMLVGL